MTTTPGADPVRLDDLADPVLSDEQRAMLAAAEADPVTLSVDAVLAAARSASGLADFGAPDFVDRLGLWLTEVDEDTNRTAYIRRRLFDDCVRFAVNRLRLNDLLARHPEIHDVEIVAPVIIVGMPRTGTTHLVNMLATDSRFRSLPHWESREPIPAVDEEARTGDDDPRLARAIATWEHKRRANPVGAVLHAMDPYHVHEELELECLDFSSYRQEWSLHMLPRWRDRYLASDQTPHYEYLRTVLKALQWRRGADRWLLKCPQHLEQLGPLMSTFPGATVVFTHRDPVSVVQSALTMVVNGARLGFRTLPFDALVDYWVDRVDRLLSAGLRDLHVIPDEQRIDLAFVDVVADDVGQVTRVYERAGIQLTAAVRRRLEAHSTANRRGAHGRVDYDLRRHFGLDPVALRRRFTPYVERFDTVAEVR